MYSREAFQCDQCDHKANCNVGLTKHIRKEHRVIPQLDGINDEKVVNEKSSQTKDPKVKETDVKTLPSDAGVTLNPPAAPENVQFKCDQCRFEAITENRVKYHTRLKHRTHHCDPGFEEYVFLPNNICPLCPVESDYCKCGSCDECQDFITEHGFNIHMMNDHSPDDILAHFGEDWIKEHTQYIHRNIKNAEDRNHSKMWDIFISENNVV